jgi:hypothetical protein
MRANGGIGIGMRAFTNYARTAGLFVSREYAGAQVAPSLIHGTVGVIMYVSRPHQSYIPGPKFCLSRVFSILAYLPELDSFPFSISDILS